MAGRRHCKPDLEDHAVHLAHVILPPAVMSKDTTVSIVNLSGGFKDEVQH